MHPKPHRASLLLTFGAFVALFSSTACNADGDCTEQSCDEFGGSASRTLTVCVSSGSGSTKDEFVLKDENDDDFYECSRDADDNDSCGVELLRAKRAYCAQSTNGTAPGGSSGSSGSSGTTDAGGARSDGGTGGSSDGGRSGTDAGSSSGSSDEEG